MQETALPHPQSHLQAVSLKITAAKSMNSMAQAMAGATKAMGAMNRQFNIPALRGIMMEFEKQNSKMEMTQEMMDDAMDDVFEASGDASLGDIPLATHHSMPCHSPSHL